MKRVKIVSAGDGRGTVYAVDGTPIPMIDRVDVTIEVGKLNVAELRMCCIDLTTEAEGKFYLIAPGGSLSEVKSIEFADGTVFKVDA